MSDIRFDVDGRGNLVFLSAGNGGNYISSRMELEIIREREGEPGTVMPFGAVTLDVSSGGRRYAGTPDCAGTGEVFSFENGLFRLEKRWRLADGELGLSVSLKNITGETLRVGTLSISLPFNNNYTRFMFDQKFMYGNRTCEHYYPCGESSYVIAEMLDGRQPLLWMLCGEGTAVEHFRKNAQSVERSGRGLANHSYPGSLEALLVAGDALALLGERVPEGASGSVRLLEPGASAVFRLRFGFAADRRAFGALRAASGQVVLRPVTGLVQPKELPFVFEVESREPVTFECAGGEAEPLGGGRYAVRFSETGEKHLWCSNGRYRAHLACYVTESVRTLAAVRADFILHKQVFRRPGDLLDCAILPYAERAFCGHTGLVAEEGSLWGTGSYEGGICDAYFAAEKNVLWPDAGEVVLLEDYIDGYVLRYLQNPETMRVSWFGYRALETRSYNYVHVANLYFSMYRISALYGLTRADGMRYLDLAAKTLEAMFPVSRAMDLVVGNMGIRVVLEVMEAYSHMPARIDRYFELKLKLMRYIENVFFDTPYASECAYDNAGYEAVIRMCMFRDRPETARDLADIIRTVRGDQPLWWWNGSDIRWWDAEFDFRENCHHYTSPYNGAALIDLLADTDWLRPDADLLASAYGGLLGVLAKIRSDGFGAMCYVPEPESENFGFHRCTGDFGVGGFAMLKNLTAFSLAEGGSRTDWLCGGEGGDYRFPAQTVRGFCRCGGGQKLTLRTDNGFLAEASACGDAFSFSLERPFGGAARLTLRSSRRLRGAEGARLLETGKGVYSLELEGAKGTAEVRVLFENR